MSFCSQLAVLFFMLQLPSVMADALAPQLGKPISADLVAGIGPDGQGLPRGAGSVSEGRIVYEAHCLVCHGPEGKMPGNALAGGRGSLATDRPNKTVGSYWPYATTLFDYINRAMPYGNEKLLSANEVYGVSAYVLFLNGILDDDESLDANALRAVVMPNREGFRNVYSVKSSD